MIRIIMRNVNFAEAANVGGPVHETLKSFDVHLPDVEAWLREKGPWFWRSTIGIEILEDK